VSVDVSVISIGALGANSLWGEREPVRTPHATTTLIRSGDANIIVDPGLPGEILGARLAERANLTPSQITHVFLTCFRPDVRRGLGLFEGAKWWINQTERESVGVPMAESLKLALEMGKDDLAEQLRADVAVLQRCEVAPDQIAGKVSLFPLPGVTPGLAGLLISEPQHTTLVCGDAVPTRDHLDQGKVLPTSANLEEARASFSEAIEIADLLVLGRDNLVVNPTRRPF